MIDYSRLVPPQRPSRLLSRSRLRDVFLGRLFELRLMVVSAPAGYGKTYTLLDLIDHAGLPVCWYTVRPLERDADRFVLHFVAAIHARFEGVGGDLLAALQGPSGNDINVDALIGSLVNELVALKERFVFVLDDFQLVEDSSGVAYFLEQFLARVGSGVHLVMASRMLPTLQVLPTLIVNEQMVGLGMDGLAFRPGEFQALLWQNYKIRLPDKQAVALVKETNGWIPALLALAEQQDEEDKIMGLASAAKFANLEPFDLLVEHVVGAFSPDFQANLMKTALLGAFNVAVCEQVLGATGGGWLAFIDKIRQRNLFVLATGQDVTYHQLFRESLVARFRKRAPQEVGVILQRLAEYYVAQGAWEEAYAVYKEAGDTGKLVSLIEQAAFSLLQTGRRRLLLAWLDGLPPDVFAQHPYLSAIRGQVRITQGDTRRGLAEFDEAMERLGRTDRNSRFYWRAVEWRITALRMLGRYQAVLVQVGEVASELMGQAAFAKIWATILRERGNCLRRLGRLAEAFVAFEESRGVFVGLGYEEGVARVENGLAIVYRERGRYDEAARLYQKALAYWVSVGNPLEQATTFNNLAVLYHHRGEYVLAVSVLVRAIGLARSYGFARIEGWALASLGDIYCELDVPEMALRVFGLGGEVAERLANKVLAQYLRVRQVLPLWLVGQEAERVLAALRPGVLAGVTWHGALYRESGRVLLAQGELAEAEPFFQQALAEFLEGERWSACMQVYVYLAAVWAGLGDLVRARVYLGLAFERLAQFEEARVEAHYGLVVPGREGLDLLQKLGDDDERLTTLLNQIREFEAAIPTLRREIRNVVPGELAPPPTLSIVALGQTSVWRNGERVVVDEWRIQPKVRELWFYLLAHPAGLTRDQIALALWPDLDPKKLSRRFGRTIERLRRAFRGLEVVIFDRKTDQRYHFNRLLDYAYDSEIFEAHISLAEQADDEKARAEAYEAARNLYTGGYLVDLDTDWVVVERAHLAKLYQEAVAYLGTYYEAVGEFDKAEMLGKTLLELESLNEAWHRLMMRVYAGQERPDLVEEQFQQCVTALQAALGIRPSRETVELYERLRDR